MKRAATLCLLLALAAAGRLAAAVAEIEIVAADDRTVTYRERVPPRVALDPRHRVYHVEGCPQLAAGMEWVSPGVATLRGYPAHGCAASRRETYVTKVETRRPRDSAVVSVLFLGNSLTYYNEMPRMLARMAAGAPRPLRVEAVTMSGASLDQLWSSTEALAAIWRDHWDFVVLQERGGRAPRDRGPLFEEYVVRFAAEVRKSGALPLLFMTWHTGQDDENARLFQRVGKSAGVQVVPVGLAWRDVLASGALAALDDGAHPDLAGSYLIACTMYAAIYGRSPAGLPFAFGDLAAPTEAYDEALRRQRLTPAQARAIQAAAWSAWQRWSS